MNIESLLFGKTEPQKWTDFRARFFLLQALVLIGAVLWIYWPSLRGTWIGDDTWYISDNPLLRDPWRIWRAWFEPGSWVEFYPIQESVQWVQWLLWHSNTLGYHLTNVFLHLLSAFLLWHFFRKLGLRLAWLGALLFAVHPEAVDSVSEIVELKNTLSLPPFILAMSLYIDFEESGSRRCYLWSFTCFVVAMLCKITMMSFPFVILLYAWWKRSRITWQDLKASLPFFLISLALVLTTIWSSHIYAHPLKNWDPVDDPLGGILFRFALGAQIFAFYFSRFFLPINPMPIYPQWPVLASLGMSLVVWLVLALVLGTLWMTRRTWGRHALLGLGFFTINLLPFLGFKGISYMNYSWVLDHMLYLPMIGLIGLVVAAVSQIGVQISAPARLLGMAALALLVGLMTIQSHLYSSQFISEETLDRYNLRFTQDMELHTNLGAALLQRGAYEEALSQFQLASRCNPYAAKVQFNLGGVFLRLGRVNESIAAYYQAANNAPDVPEVRGALADTLFSARRLPEAVQQYKEALRLKLAPSRMYGRIGECFFMEGKFAEGLDQFRRSVEVDPSSPLAHYNLGKALCNTGQIDAGISQYRKAIQLEPGYAEAHNNLGTVLFRRGHVDEAREEFRLAIRWNPNYNDARNNLQLADRISSIGR